jgi:hypothetical protein
MRWTWCLFFLLQFWKFALQEAKGVVEGTGGTATKWWQDEHPTFCGCSPSWGTSSSMPKLYVLQSHEFVFFFRPL